MNGPNGVATLCKQVCTMSQFIVNVIQVYANFFQDPNEAKQMSYMDEKKNGVEVGMRRMKLGNGGIPGVFNCRFANPTVANPNRKKKKPTTFVPPPPPPPQPSAMVANAIGEARPRLNGTSGPRQLIPFWRRPLSMASSQSHDHQV